MVHVDLMMRMLIILQEQTILFQLTMQGAPLVHYMSILMELHPRVLHLVHYILKIVLEQIQMLYIGLICQV